MISSEHVAGLEHPAIDQIYGVERLSAFELSSQYGNRALASCHRDLAVCRDQHGAGSGVRARCHR
jgi:hypothetical protein